MSNPSSRLCHILQWREKKKRKNCQGRNVTLILHVGLFEFLFCEAPPWFAEKSNKWAEQYSGQMWAASRLGGPEPRRWGFGANAKHWAQTRRWGAAWRRSIIYATRRGRRSTDLYPLPDGVIRGRPAVLRVVETGALGRPAGVVLGGCGDLLRGDLPRLHAQRLHAGEICHEQKNSIKASKPEKSLRPKRRRGSIFWILGFGAPSGAGVDFQQMNESLRPGCFFFIYHHSYFQTVHFKTKYCTVVIFYHPLLVFVSLH